MSTFLNASINEATPFPDGQQHVAFGHIKDGSEQTLTCRIVTAKDFVNVALAVDVLKSHKCKIDLRIVYLMGARMDRRLSEREPYTLKAMTNLVNSLDVDSVTVFCPHSKTTLDLLKNYSEYDNTLLNAEEMFYDFCTLIFLRKFHPSLQEFRAAPMNAEIRNLTKNARFSIVYPDEGAKKRYVKSQLLINFPHADLVTLSKDREERTGIIKGMKIVDGTPEKCCIIIDDLCDGGATFKGAAKALKENGAQYVALAVSHGIFSKGLPIEGVDWVGTTNSFREEKIDGLDYFFKLA